MATKDIVVDFFSGLGWGWGGRILRFNIMNITQNNIKKQNKKTKNKKETRKGSLKINVLDPSE